VLLLKKLGEEEMRGGGGSGTDLEKVVSFVKLFIVIELDL
jgi:hypothetical protein